MSWNIKLIMFSLFKKIRVHSTLSVALLVQRVSLDFLERK